MLNLEASSPELFPAMLEFVPCENLWKFLFLSHFLGALLVFPALVIMKSTSSSVDGQDPSMQMCGITWSHVGYGYIPSSLVYPGGKEMELLMAHSSFSQFIDRTVNNSSNSPTGEMYPSNPWIKCTFSLLPSTLLLSWSLLHYVMLCLLMRLLD